MDVYVHVHVYVDGDRLASNLSGTHFHLGGAANRRVNAAFFRTRQRERERTRLLSVHVRSP